jgi:hypothetical protein
VCVLVAAGPGWLSALISLCAIKINM